ncbi:MAG: hypothetical protein DMG57_43950 [Acidobacteria bacterium]|nr:MAG: hypothetical protein DMG57_43950 [Acidobacteriota bacterium]
MNWDEKSNRASLYHQFPLGLILRRQWVRRFDSNARRQISAHAVELKIRAAAQTGIGTKARFRRKTLRKADFNAGFFN